MDTDSAMICTAPGCGKVTPRRFGRALLYCSKECRYEHKFPISAPKICKRCGEEFVRKFKLSRKAWADQKFCSADCAGSKNKNPDPGGKSQSEIAAMLGVSVKAVQQIEYRAMRKLKAAIMESPVLMEYFQ